MSWSTPWADDDFEAVLELLGRAADEEARRNRAASDRLHTLLETLDRGPEPGTKSAYVPPGLLGRLYAAEGSPRPAGRPAPKSDHESVVAELRLTPDLGADDLKRLRRLFAAVNHPDRVPPAHREQATRRMTIANTLIDQAIAQRRNNAS